MTTPEPRPENLPPVQATKESAPEPEAIRLLHNVKTVVHDRLKSDALDLTALSSTELARIRSELAVSRTMMAGDRTLMAWIRTSLSLIGFGFTIYKVLQGFQASGAELSQSESPRQVGLFLTGLGVIAMVMGTVEYWRTLKDLRKIEPIRLLRMPLVFALVISVVGVSTFFSITVKLF